MSWGDHYELATARMKVAPADFWCMTPMEFEALCMAHLKAQPGYVAPVTWDEFDALRKRFPDRRADGTTVH